MEYLRLPALEVRQGDYTFYSAVATAKSLLRIAYVQARESGEGVQRILSATRLKEIGRYVQRKKPPGLLPNAIILRLSKDAVFDAKKGELRVPKRSREAFVVDGQHRLFAFGSDYVGDFDTQLPVTAFIGLPIDEVAYLFRTINFTQRKINPSLVYDLVPYLREKDWVEFEDSRAQHLVQQLAEDEDSPWYRGIAMLGGRDEPITQASFVTVLKRLLKRGEILSESFMQGAFAGLEIQYELLLNYFTAVEQVFRHEWRNPAYVVSKNLGVSSLLNVLRPVVLLLGHEPEDFFRGDELLLKPAKFHPHVRRLRGAVSWRRDEMAKTYLGAAGIRTLTDELIERLPSSQE